MQESFSCQNLLFWIKIQNLGNLKRKNTSYRIDSYELSNVLIAKCGTISCADQVKVM